MGTFERFAIFPIATGGDWVDGIPGITKVIGAVLAGEVGNTSVSLGLGSNVIYLDGNYTTPIGINDLPPGFTILTAFIQTAVALGQVDQELHVEAFGFISPTDIVGQTGLAQVAISPLPTNAALFSSTTIITSIQTFIGNSILANLLVQEHPSLPGFCVLAGISGTYEAQSFQYTLDVPTDPLEPGDIVQATSPDTPLGIDWTRVDSVTLAYFDSNGDPQTINVPPELWVLITFTIFIFIIPSFPTDATVFTIIITSTQFSGSVTLGKLITIYFENAPGIYSIVPGKTNDTLYDITDPGTTIDVKIPNPIWKTGFIGG
jgi:hypothetical protein